MMARRAKIEAKKVKKQKEKKKRAKPKIIIIIIIKRQTDDAERTDGECAQKIFLLLFQLRLAFKAVF